MAPRSASPMFLQFRLPLRSSTLHFLLLLGFFFPVIFASQVNNIVARQDAAASTSSALPASTGVLDMFQVAVPVLGPSGTFASTDYNDVASGNATISASNCQVTLMNFSFVNSFGKPFVGNYNPPSCITGANTVMMTFTVASKGVQFDRLAIMYIGDSEVFRTSTAEPKRTGITWDYTKDMSQYMSLWKSPQKIIFDLGNMVTTNLTGTYDTKLTATFFTAADSVSAADMIIPITARQGVNASSASVFSFPAANASTTVSFPRNANRAVFSLSSCGQAGEEFWWSNTLQSDASTFAASDGILPALSPFREVQVYIDGQMAGVQWPFPVIFTGGVVPGLWSPIVGIDAFDLKEYEIDITPWLPLLCDGKRHTFTMKVVGLVDNGRNSATISDAVGSSWFLSGNIFVWLDAAGSITTGTNPTISIPAPTISVSQSLTKNSTGANETLTYTTSVNRRITISSTIKTQTGTHPCTWSQTLAHTDLSTYLAFGNTQLNNITTTGTDTSRGPAPFTTTYSYPLYANTTAVVRGQNVTVSALLDRTKRIATSGASIYPSGLQAFSANARAKDRVPNFSGTTLETRQQGAATFVTGAAVSFTFGSSRQVLRFGAVSARGALGMQPDAELYFRDVAAVNSSVVADVERVAGQRLRGFDRAVGGADAGVVAGAEMEVELDVGGQLLAARVTGLQKDNLVSGMGVAGPVVGN